MPPPPLPLGSCGGAFTMYVRGSTSNTEVGRGEPDGRTAPPPAPPPPRYRGESDAAFTPSPPAAAPSTSTAPQRDVSLALAHQTKIRTLYTRRPPSTDDSDWESSGHDTVLRRRPEHTRYLDAFYDLASAQPRRTEEEKPDPALNQPSTSKRATRSKIGSSSRDSMAQVRHMSGELTPTISEVYHERNIGLGLAPPLAELLLAEESKTEMRAASSSENLLLQNLEKLGLLGDTSENEERWCSSNTSRPWLSAPPLETDVQGSDLTTAEIIERQTKFKKDEPKRKEENAYELKPKEETPGPSGIEKRSVSPFSELSRRDEGDGRSIADSHSSYKALVLNPRTPYLPEEGEAVALKPVAEGGKTHPRPRRPPVPRTRPAYTTLDFPPNK